MQCCIVLHVEVHFRSCKVVGTFRLSGYRYDCFSSHVSDICVQRGQTFHAEDSDDAYLVI